MIVDTSAIVAITRGESDAAWCMDVIRRASERRMSAGNLLEGFMVIDGPGNPSTSEKLDTLITTLRLMIEPVTHEQIRVAREAFRRYGKGNRHPARLNYGDCFAYSLAKARGEPLLFIGNDFIHTDIVQAT